MKIPYLLFDIFFSNFAYVKKALRSFYRSRGLGILNGADLKSELWIGIVGPAMISLGAYSILISSEASFLLTFGAGVGGICRCIAIFGGRG